MTQQSQNNKLVEVAVRDVKNVARQIRVAMGKFYNQTSARNILLYLGLSHTLLVKSRVGKSEPMLMSMWSNLSTASRWH